MIKTSLGRFRIVAFLEGVSYLLLSVTMILKYKYSMPEPNMIVGSAHGGLFILYVIFLLQVGLQKDWSWMKMGLGFLAALIPFGTFWADVKLFRN